MKALRIVLAVSLLILNSCELIDDIFADKSGIDVQTYSTSIPNVRDVFFINKSVGYAVGYEGMIKKTTDGGKTWEDQESGTTLILTTVFFVNENSGFATGAYTRCPEEDCNKSGIFLKTTDGGKTWEKELKPDIAFFYDLCFFDENSGIGVLLTMDSERYAATTEDGGITWKYLDLKMPDIMFSNNHSIENIFLRDTVCYLLGDEQLIYKSTDLCKTWETIHAPVEIRNTSFISSEVGFIYGFRPEHLDVYKTSNGGKTWNILPEPDDPVGFSHFFDEFNGFSIQYNSEYPPMGDFPTAVSTNLYYTSDGGISWQSEEHPEIISGYKSFPTNKIGFYVNDENTYVLKLK